MYGEFQDSRAESETEHAAGVDGNAPRPAPMHPKYRQHYAAQYLQTVPRGIYINTRV